MGRKRRRNLRGKLQILRDGRAKEYPLPHPQKIGDVGFDLTATEDVAIPPGIGLPPTEIPTGVRIKLPKGTFAIFFRAQVRIPISLR